MAAAPYPDPSAPARPRLLVIKLGALGDFIHAFHGFAAIRASRPESHITLLTTDPFRALAQAAPWFDAVALDARAPWWHVPAIARTLRLLRTYDYIYDLQTSSRTARYFHLSGRKPWSGHVARASHPHANPERDAMHTLERQREQLELAGVAHWPTPDRAWLSAAGQRHGLSQPYALLVPGGAGLGAVKRWPVARYAEVARWLVQRGLTPVIIGGRQEEAMGAAIQAQAPGTRDLTGRTTIADIAALAERAAVVLGNDTGPTHVAAAMGAPAIALFSAATVPAQAAPRGPSGEWLAILRSRDLDALALGDVLAALEAALTPPALPAPPPAPRPAAERTSLRSAAK